MPKWLYKNELPMSQVLQLYDSVGWSSYSRHPEQLEQALRASLLVVSVWQDEQLLGLARAVGDGHTIIYIQDILVRPNAQRQGWGRQLLQRLLDHFPEVRQKVLLTDDTPRTRAFYTALGFRPCDDGVLLAFARYDNV